MVEQKTKMVVYHYTNKEGLQAIQKSGYIKESLLDDKDAVFGQGVYLTTMGPDQGKDKIAQNNYDDKDLWKIMKKKGRVDWAIKLTIPENQLEEKKDSGRDVLVYKGKLELKDYKHEIICVEMKAVPQKVQT